MANGLIGGIAGLATAGSGRGSYNDAVRIWRKLKESDFDFRALNAPELRQVAEFFPELYTAITPEEFTQIEDSPEVRARQMRSLDLLGDVAEEGEPLVDRLSRQEASRSVMGAAQAAQLDALRSLAARGQLSTGDELQARIAGNQGVSNLARDLGNDAATMSALRRIAAARDVGHLAGAVRGQDIDLRSRNADIANRFKELFASMKTQEARDAAAARERAQAYNVGTAQRIADSNPLLRYETERENLDRKNRLLAEQWNQRYARAAGLAGAFTNKGAFQERVGQRQADAIGDIGGGATDIIGSIFGAGYGGR